LLEFPDAGPKFLPGTPKQITNGMRTHVEQGSDVGDGQPVNEAQNRCHPCPAAEGAKGELQQFPITDSPFLRSSSATHKRAPSAQFRADQPIDVLPPTLPPSKAVEGFALDDLMDHGARVAHDSARGIPQADEHILRRIGSGGLVPQDAAGSCLKRRATLTCHPVPRRVALGAERQAKVRHAPPARRLEDARTLT
jgi:hypothetical protein